SSTTTPAPSSSSPSPEAGARHEWANARPRALSEIVPGVGEVEGLVAEGKVRNDVLQHGVLERGPVAEGRIDDLHAAQGRRSAGHHPVPGRATPRLDETERVGARGERRDLDPQRSRAVEAGGLANQARRLARLVEAHHGARPDVARPIDRDVDT